eukprot:g32017.t1
MNQEVHSLLKTRCAAFKSGDLDQYRKSRYNLHKAIRDAKRRYWTKLEAQTYQTDSHCLWQGLNYIMGHKMKQNKIANKDTSLPDVLNAFYARFEQIASGTVIPAPTIPDTRVPSVTTSDVRLVFLGVNPRKAMGLDEDAISLALHSSLERLDNKDMYVRLLLIDYSSAFKTIIHSKLISKLCGLGLSSALCNWILSFLIHRLQSVRI